MLSGGGSFVTLGAKTGLILIRSEAPRVFRCAFLRRNPPPSFTSSELNKGEGKKGEFLSCGT